MADRHAPDELLSFPCRYEFKVFGSATDDAFSETVYQAVNQIMPVERDALRVRLSSGGKYQSITALVRLENSAQLTKIYAILRGIEGMLYLL
jgi:hypothetical protein